MSAPSPQAKNNRIRWRRKDSKSSSSSQSPTQDISSPYVTGIPPRYPLCAFPTIPLDAPREEKERVRKALEEEEARRYGDLKKIRAELKQFENAVSSMSLDPNSPDELRILHEANPYPKVKSPPPEWAFGRETHMNCTNELEEYEIDRKRYEEGFGPDAQPGLHDYKNKVSQSPAVGGFPAGKSERWKLEFEAVNEMIEEPIVFGESTKSTKLPRALQYRIWYHLRREENMTDQTDIEQRLGVPPGTLPPFREDEVIHDEYSFEEMMGTIRYLRNRSLGPQSMVPFAESASSEMKPDGLFLSKGSSDRQTLGPEGWLDCIERCKKTSCQAPTLPDREGTDIPYPSVLSQMVFPKYQSEDMEVSPTEPLQCSNPHHRDRTQGQPILNEEVHSRSKRTMDASTASEEDVIHLVPRKSRKPALETKSILKNTGVAVAVKKRKTSQGAKPTKTTPSREKSAIIELVRSRDNRR